MDKQNRSSPVKLGASNMDASDELGALLNGSFETDLENLPSDRQSTPEPDAQFFQTEPVNQSLASRPIEQIEIEGRLLSHVEEDYYNFALDSDDNDVTQSSNQSQQTISPVNKPKRRSYTIADKLRVLKLLEENNGNIYKTGEQSKIDRKNIYRWKSQSILLEKAKNNLSEIVRTRRKVKPVEVRGRYPELEQELKRWFDDRRKNGYRIDRLMIRDAAMKIAQERGILCSTAEPLNRSDNIFRASSGWMHRFLRRHKITMRQSTSIGQEEPVNAKNIALNFLTYLGDLRQKYEHCDQIVYGNMDEVPVWFDFPGNRTYDYVGNRTINLKTTGHEKLRFTAVLCGLSTGEKVKPMVIFKASENRISKENVPGVVLTGSKGGSMTADLMELWRKKCWEKRPNHILQNIQHNRSKKRSFLIMDSHSSHLGTDLLKKFNENNNTDTVIIPGGMTKHLQPADVVYNRSFKTIMKRKWQDWLENSPPQYTPAGNRKKASYSEAAIWIRDAWNEVPVELIRESFDKCGITNEDNSELFHNRLLSLVTSCELNVEESQPTGISDDELDFEEENDENQTIEEIEE